MKNINTRKNNPVVLFKQVEVPHSLVFSLLVFAVRFHNRLLLGNTIERVLGAEITMGEYEVLMEKARIN